MVRAVLCWGRGYGAEMLRWKPRAKYLSAPIFYYFNFHILESSFHLSCYFFLFKFLSLSFSLSLTRSLSLFFSLSHTLFRPLINVNLYYIQDKEFSLLNFIGNAILPSFSCVRYLLWISEYVHTTILSVIPYEKLTWLKFVPCHASTMENIIL